MLRFIAVIEKNHIPHIFSLKEAIEISFEPEQDPHVHGLNVKGINLLKSGNRQEKNCYYVVEKKVAGEGKWVN